ncbi:MAG: Rne/Rng family ribonuclease [Microbacteriaceae bacterium]|nr:Rne/Rng family ribonuclease [Microbacteriaceae bacterium]
MVSDDNEKTTKKRTRLFASRAPKKASEHAAQSVPGFDGGPLAEPEAASVDADAVMDAAEAAQPAADAEKASEASAVDEASVADETPADETSAAVETPAEPPAPAAAFPELKPESTTSLLFFAPPVEVLAPRGAPVGTSRSSRTPIDLDDVDEEGTVTSRRRSRSRRTRGGAEGDTGRTESTRDDDSTTRTRAARRPAELITEPQRIKGSTRLEAKKQRRRDGRDAGRRRPVVTEAEFLARRESVDRQMIVRSKDGRIQIGVLEDGVLVEHYVARSQESSLIGNVYLGRVQNVLPSMEAAFVDIGRGRNAVLYSGEVDWDSAALDSDGKTQPRRIELALKPGDKVLVQVTKDPIGHKGARLTSQVSLPGRYLVYVPNGSMSGISRKLPDTERARLKKILKEVLPENVGVIVRTAAEGATEEQLTLDVQRLTSQWAEISKRLSSTPAPAMLHSEPDLLIKIIRDVFNEDFRSLVISGADAQQTIEAYLRGVAPDLLDRVQKHEGDHDPFDEYRISEQIEKALDRKVWLPSGGSLIIDRTEAMTVVDVNTGKFVGSGGNLEETVTKNNLEAAEELVRQLRLRDIGGIIVVDFIDMVLESNRDLVLRRLMECLSRDRTKHQVAEVTSLGLVQMTRKRLGLGLLETFSESCEVCGGRGLIVHHEPVVRHRQGSDTAANGGGIGGSSGRRRGGSGNGSGTSGQNGSGRGASPKSGTTTAAHAITDDVSRAVAAIAAKTVHHDAPTTGTIELPVVSPAEPAPSAPSAASAELATVEILDIPVSKKPARSRAPIDATTADQLLGSVLKSLPEPPAPGTRKRASRRVSSGTISTQTEPEGS